MFQFVKIVAITVTILHLTKSNNDTDFGLTYEPGDPRACLKKYTKLTRSEVLPGTGWDNLCNKDTGNVIVHSYRLCKTTLDGRYLIPDDVETLPRKSSRVRTLAELISHYTDYTSITARSINVHAGLSLARISIGGSFSDRYQQVKRKQIMERSVTTRVEVRYVGHTAMLKRTFKLVPKFKTRLIEIANSLSANRSKEARYKSQLLIRDYGTHFLKSVDAGAVLVQEDQISSDYFSSNNSTTADIQVAAGASFLNIFNFGTSYKTLTARSNNERYQQLRLSSKILTFGGPKFMTQNFTINDWSNKIDDNMVAVDRHGEPLFYLITETNLPELSAFEVYTLQNHVKRDIYLYYKQNTYKGCTDLESPNFSPAANIDDGSCTPPINSTKFGGVFQTCDLDPRSNYDDICLVNYMNQKDPLTGDYSCPDGYETVKITSGTLSTKKPNQGCVMCDEEFYMCCQNEKYEKYKFSSGNYSLYWCGANNEVQQNPGYLFGGVFTSEKSNPLTQAKSCPEGFYPRNLGTDLRICVGADYEVGRKYAQMFGGFFSCDSGNPLAVNKNKNEVTVTSKPSLNWPQRCPPGYSQHLAFVNQDCEIKYCFKSNHISIDLPQIKRPPFIINLEDEIFIPPKTTNVFITNPEDEISIPLKNTSVSAAVVLTASVFLFVGSVLTAGIIYVLAKRRHRNNNSHDIRYSKLNNTNDNC